MTYKACDQVKAACEQYVRVCVTSTGKSATLQMHTCEQVMAGQVLESQNVDISTEAS